MSLIAGLKLPTGVTGAINGQGERAEVTIQPGTGSLDGFIGVNARQTILTVPMFSGKYSELPLTLMLQVNGAGTDDYKFGNTFHAHLGTSHRFINRASFLMQVNSRFQSYADVGSTDEPRENTGGTWIFLSPGLGLQLSDALSGKVYVQGPISQDVHGIQQTARFNLLLDISYGFSLIESE